VCSVASLSSPAFAQSPAKSLTGYNIITVEAVTVEKTPKAEKFTDEFASQFQQRIVDQFRKKKVFLEVIDGTSKIDSAPVDPAIKHLILTTTIIEFDPGNKALRYTIGWGAGSTKVKAKFVFRDAATKQELLITTYQGKFLGFINVIGKGNHPVNEASGDVIDGLIREINKNR
jgi:hypothetical protein